MKNAGSGPNPWHREPLVWMVLAIPAAAVVAGAVMLVLANATWDGLVADDYYKRGLEINRSLARDEEAVRLGIHASLAFPGPGVVEARVNGIDGAGAGGSFSPGHREPCAGSGRHPERDPGRGHLHRARHLHERGMLRGDGRARHLPRADPGRAP